MLVSHHEPQATEQTDLSVVHVEVLALACPPKAGVPRPGRARRITREVAAQDIGLHYATTLKLWHENWVAAKDAILALGPFPRTSRMRISLPVAVLWNTARCVRLVRGEGRDMSS